MQPVAVTGIGCRFPGDANGPTAFWRMLLDGVDAIQDPPPDRPLPSPGGFLKDVAGFDAGFFGIVKREADAMDPQQRLLLEVAWEALEDAGWPLERMAGTRMGVFTACSNRDYAELQGPDSITAYSIAGWTCGLAPNRIAFALDLQGPCLNVDSFQSSSLVAIQQALHGLALGTCDTALVGAANVMLHERPTLAFNQLGALSPTARCRAFDTSADGFVRSEGAGCVVLKPLSRALEDGDRIYAVILQAAVNSDGHKTGFTAPSVVGQSRLLHEAYRDFDIDRVQYVEAHGPGTPVGDPIELQALGQVLGGRERRLRVGSVKSNIGHLEAAAGMAGLIKACLMARHRVVPPSLHCSQPRPEVAQHRMHVPTDVEPLPAGDILLGVSAFGLGGTNAHVVLAPPPSLSTSTWSGPAAPHVLCLSGRSEAALKALQVAVASSPARLPEVAAGLLEQRTHHAYRMAVVAQSLEDLRASWPIHQVEHPPRVAFVYSGQGGQWPCMGRGLLDVAELEPSFQRFAGWSLQDALASDETPVHQTSITQPLIFGVQVALTRLLAAWGVVPDLVIGHSMGEIAAAWACGALELEDAVRLAVHRGRVMECDTARGSMLAVLAGEAEVRPHLEGQVGIAAINAPGNVTLSGPSDEMARVTASLQAAGIETREVRVEYAGHGAQLEPLRDGFLAGLQGLRPVPPRRPMLSTVTAGPPPPLDADYWWRNFRQPVRFMETVQASDAQVFVEIGPHPVLGTSLLACGVTPVAVMRRNQPDRQTFLEGLAELYRMGLRIRWGETALPPRVDLPAYPWQHQRHWQASRDTAEESREPASPLAPVSLLSQFRAQVAQLTGTSEDRVDTTRPLSDMALDSLMSLQLRNWIKSRLGVSMSGRDLLAQPSLEALAQALDAQAPAEEEPIDVAAMDDAQVDAMLTVMLLGGNE
ncbi:MAG: type I polyketide synthase [Candidatus Xenobia bacterium]